MECDAILYAPYTLARARAARHQRGVFDGTKNLRAIFVEVGDFTPEGVTGQVTEAWLRDHARPYRMYQRFWSSQGSKAGMQHFMADLPSRRFGDALFILCGESNIVGTKRDKDDIADAFEMDRYLQSEGISIVLNPVHDYMRRYEMKEKRSYLSKGGRTVLSVWNMGKGCEPGMPWTVYHDGHDRTDQVELVDPSEHGVELREDVRIGIVELTKL